MEGLSAKIANNERGILLYGITPPKITTGKNAALDIAQKLINRLENLDIDGLVIYDLQDESARNKDERTFEFVRTIAPEIYLNDYLKNRYEAVIYKAVANYSQSEFRAFLQIFSGLGVFVGASSASDEAALKLPEAYKIAKEQQNRAGRFYYGGIAIPERHIKKGDEHKRVADKIAAGCDFFITQAVYDIDTAKKFIDDYAASGARMVPMIFTLTPCGDNKTLNFMRWLGISMPQSYEERIFKASDPLAESLKLSLEMFEFLYHYGSAKGISVGANVESISTKKAEIEASIELVNSIKSTISVGTDGFTAYRHHASSASKGLD